VVTNEGLAFNTGVSCLVNRLPPSSTSNLGSSQGKEGKVCFQCNLAFYSNSSNLKMYALIENSHFLSSLTKKLYYQVLSFLTTKLTGKFDYSCI